MDPQVLRNIVSFPTQTDVCIFTDECMKLQEVLNIWKYNHVSICSHDNREERDNSFAVVWDHRYAVESAMKTGADVFNHVLYKLLPPFLV